MKENPIPTRDLKNSSRLLAPIFLGTFEAVKPTLERKAVKTLVKILRSNRINY